MLDMSKISTAELREFAARLYTSHMERVLIEAAKAELKKREESS